MSPEDRSRNQSTAASLLIALQKILLFEANDSLNVFKFSKLFDFLHLSTSYVKQACSVPFAASSCFGGA
jgi:hypothetical protein